MRNYIGYTQEQLVQIRNTLLSEEPVPYDHINEIESWLSIYAEEDIQDEI